MLTWDAEIFLKYLLSADCCFSDFLLCQGFTDLIIETVIPFESKVMYAIILRYPSTCINFGVQTYVYSDFGIRNT